MLDDKGGPLGAHDELLDDLACVDTLLRVEVCRGFVDKQDVGGDTEHKTDGNSLQLSSGQSVWISQMFPLFTEKLTSEHLGR